MGLYRSLSGSARVRIESADLADCLSSLEREQISASAIQTIDQVTLEMTVSRRQLLKLQQLCDRKGYALHLNQKRGLFWLLGSVLNRPIFLVGMMVLLFAASILPGRILFIETEGNITVPSRYILEQAEGCGLDFWCRRRDIHNEQIKNGLLEAIPQLQWVGVNTYGCRAVITVRERSERPAEEQAGSVSHIAASRDGVIESCTVTRGFGTCTVGQAVRAGDILISGFTDCGLSISAERAAGEVLAKTKRSIVLVSPVNCKIQSLAPKTDDRFCLLIGKKRINFYKGSGISGATCDKMYSKYVLTLPGGFALPVALLKETTTSCYLTEATANPIPSMLETAAAAYLREQMTDGVILQKSEVLTESDGIFQLDGVYDCIENIGIVQEEKIGEFNG